MPFGLSSSRSSSKSSVKSQLSDMESGRFNMSGILHDGYKNKSTGKSRKSPNRASGKQQQQQHQVKQNQNQNHHDQQQYEQQYQQQQYQHIKQTPPRSRTPSGRSPTSHRPRSNNRYPPSQHQNLVQHQQQQQQQHEIQQQQYSSMHDHVSISQSHSNHSLGSRHSSHSKHSSSSASGQKRHHHQHRSTVSSNSSSGHSPSSSNASSRYHHQQHNRVPSASSELGSVHSLPTVTSRSTISDPSGHSRSGGGGHHTHSTNDSRRTHSNHQYNMTEHRDPHGETTNTRRTQLQRQVVDHHHSNFNTPQRHHRNGSHQTFPPNGSSTSFPASPRIKPTPMKSSGASVSSFHSRGSMSYNSGVPNSGKSIITTTTSVVSKDKHAIKSTKKVIEELKKSNDISYPADKRIIALTNACAEFDHLDDSRHNMELQQGAAVVLCKVLALILNSTDSEDNDGKCDYGVGRDYEYAPKSSGTDSFGSDNRGNNGNGAKNNDNEGDTKHTNTNRSSSEDNDNYDDALRMIATALEMVFRGQSAYVHSAYDKCGGNAQYEEAMFGPSPTGVLPLLLKLLDRAEGLHNNYRMKQHNAEVTLVNATKVLLYLSRVPELRIHLARQPVLLDALSRVANKDMYNIGTPDSNVNSTSAEARVVRVRIITNLVNQEENKSSLLAHRLSKRKDQNNITGSAEGGVLDALLRVAHMDPNDRAREYAGVALMDLASAPSNQIPMTKNEQLLGTLVKMILLEKNTGTRESAITALQNLAFTKENRIRLVSFKRGVILEALIRALSNTGKDFNEKSRRRSAGALTNLACDESAGLMGRHKGLLQTLAIVSTKDESPEVQTRAAMALTKLAASITVRMDASKNHESDSQEQRQGEDNADGGMPGIASSVHSTLLDALVAASLSPVSNSVSAVLRVKARDPENRYLMAKHPGILDTLADMCLYDNDGRIIRGGNNKNSNMDGDDGKNMYTIDVIKDRDNATRALMHLTNESKNRAMMCTPTVLNALVRGASVTDEEIRKEAQQKQLQDVRDSAIRAIERLATEFSNRHTMAHHDGLIVAIAHATEREAKLEAGIANRCVVIEDQPAISSGTGTTTSTNDSVECSSYNSVLTPMKPRNQNQLHDPQHAYLAKPLLMSLLVAM